MRRPALPSCNARRRLPNGSRPDHNDRRDAVSIPRAADPAPFNVTRASHVVRTVRDLARSRAFYVDMMGLVVTLEEKGTLYLRGLEEACHHSIVLKQSDGPLVCERVGMRVRSEDDLHKAK